MSKNYDKIMLVIVMGSIWGAFEIFGAEFMKIVGVPHRSPFLFAFAILIMYAAKRMADIRGSAVAMAAVAGLYKVLSFSLPACGSTAVMAVMIDGIVFETAYLLFKRRLESGTLARILAAPVLAYSSYLLFAVYAGYINPESPASGGPQGRFGSGNFRGIADYLSNSALLASLLSIATINLGPVLGNVIRAGMTPQRLIPKTAAIKFFGLFILIGVWVARIIY